VAEKQYRAAAVERAMKVQEVIMRAMAKKITWWQAAEILRVSTRTTRRMKLNWKRRDLMVYTITVTSGRVPSEYP
jgi:hypothetical protein